MKERVGKGDKNIILEDRKMREKEVKFSDEVKRDSFDTKSAPRQQELVRGKAEKINEIYKARKRTETAI